MRSFVCLSSLLLLALFTEGRVIPPGWWCDGKPCPPRIKEARDSRIDHTTAANVTVNNATTHTAVTPDGPQVGWWSGWWCKTHPCPSKKRGTGDGYTYNTTVANIAVKNITTQTTLPSHGHQRRPVKWWCGTQMCHPPPKRETRDSYTNNTAVADIAVKNTTTHTTVANHGPQYGPTKWWCGTHLCGATTKEKRENDIHNTTTNATVPDDDPHRSWLCHGRICPPKLKVIKNRQINDTALNDTTTNVTASNQAGHRRIKPAIIWWCDTHPCPSSVKTVEKRETDPLAPEASRSS